MGKTKQRYGSLDWFRLAAAALVIIIHSSPFEYVSPWADLFFTGIIGRIAVPFFFMVTGFFTDFANFDKIKKSAVKLGIMYGLCILLYLPIGLIAGDYKGDHFGIILRKIFFDGTYYHLWYFPATILGLFLVYLLKKIPNRKVFFAVTAVLYIFGVFGDSYFGISAKIPPLNAVYNGLFYIFSYTRNGFFFAPLFLIAGNEIRNFKIGKNRFIYIVGLILSFGLMTIEGTVLSLNNIPRHQCMYIFLVPVMLCLFMLLLTFSSPSRPKVRKASTWIYVLHPIVIIALHTVSKILKIPDYQKKLAVLTSILTIIITFIAGFVIPYLLDKAVKKFKKRKRLNT